MTKKTYILSIMTVVLGLTTSCQGPTSKQAEQIQAEQNFDKSLVYLEISVSGYEQLQPWKRTSMITQGGFGTVVGPYQIVTTAENVINSTMIQVRCHGINEYLSAEVKVVDYDLNLCLLEIEDKEKCPELTPVVFEEVFEKGKELVGYWLSSSGEISNSRGHMDRVRMMSCPTTFQSTLSVVITNTSRTTTSGQLYCLKEKPAGIASKGSGDDAGLIPSETIKRFLSQALEPPYRGFASTGFEIFHLTDPTVRRYLQMPSELTQGVYVSQVYNNGTGSDLLNPGDVILSIDSQEIDSFGYFEHPSYGRLSYEYLIHKKNIGDLVRVEIWRNGTINEMPMQCRNFESKDMMVPYQEYGVQSEYLVTGGFVFQKLTRDYLQMWGENWQGKTPPHLFQYYRDKSLSGNESREDIILLSYVLPSPINLGYHGLGRLVVKSVNGKGLTKFSDLKKELDSETKTPFHIIEFEMDHPTLVIPKEPLPMMDMQIQQMYGIDKPYNIGD